MSEHCDVVYVVAMVGAKITCVSVYADGKESECVRQLRARGRKVRVFRDYDRYVQFIDGYRGERIRLLSAVRL